MRRRGRWHQARSPNFETGRIRHDRSRDDGGGLESKSNILRSLFD
jgi:hypothetical protein